MLFCRANTDLADKTIPSLPQREALVNSDINQCFHLKLSGCALLNNSYMASEQIAMKLPQQVALTTLQGQVRAVVRVPVTTKKLPLVTLPNIVK